MWKLSGLYFTLAVGFLAGCEAMTMLIPACVETDHVRMPGDAADDVAIWVNPKKPEESAVIGTNKKAGLHLYDLAGREIQFVPLGGINNVDLRTVSFDAPTTVIAASSRSGHDGESVIMLFRFDEALRRISAKPLAEIPTGFHGGPGVCLYVSPDGMIHVGAAGRTGFRQWHLTFEAGRFIRAALVRELKLQTPAEGCVFDDKLQRLYLAEQKVGLWRLAAEPTDRAKIMVDGVKPNGGFTHDIEGLAIYALDEETGYLVASSQGDSSFRIYLRHGSNDFVSSFKVVGCHDRRIDGVTHTDGIEVASTSLGANWPGGLLVVQDDENTDPTKPQNFKYISWDMVLGGALR